MRRKIYLLLTISVTLFITSCVGTNTEKMMRTTTFLPNNIELKLTLDDFEYLGDIEISVQYSKYIGIINFYDKVNDREVPKRNANFVSLYGKGNVPMGPKLRQALYEAHIKMPEADILVPVHVISETQQMFLGRKIKKTCKVKGYKIREN
ncbi:hypothetical protein ACFLTE_05555 [Bacteroidota bacterium]